MQWSVREVKSVAKIRKDSWRFPGVSWNNEKWEMGGARNR